MRPIVWNSGALTLPPRSISVISVQSPTDIGTKHLYQLDAADDLPSGIIPLAVGHKIHHKQPKLFKIPLINTQHSSVCNLRKTIIGNLQPIDVADFEVNSISWMTYGTANTTNSPTELPCTPSEASF